MKFGFKMGDSWSGFGEFNSPAPVDPFASPHAAAGAYPFAAPPGGGSSAGSAPPPPDFGFDD